MKNKQVFFNPFRLISPKLDREASRLANIYDSAPEELTCLEEGLIIMLTKLREMAELLHKSLLLEDKEKIAKCGQLGREIHEEEKSLINALICSPRTTGDILKAVLLFPARLERCGDLFESIQNVASIKAIEGIPFSDKAVTELTKLFTLLSDMLKNFRDLLTTLNPTLLDILNKQHEELGQMTVDFALAHEDRLIDGYCVPKASSLYMDILDSVRGINQHLQDMTNSLNTLAEKYKA